MHMEPLAECIERYKSICDKLDGVMQRLDKINGRYDAHLTEAVSYRSAVDAHTQRFDQLDGLFRALIGVLISIIFAIILQITTFSFLWGGLSKQVEINTQRWGQVISGKEIHAATNISKGVN